MHSRSSSHASDYLPPFFKELFSFLDFDIFLDLFRHPLSLCCNWTTFLEVTLPVIYLVTSTHVSAPALLIVCLHFAL